MQTTANEMTGKRINIWLSQESEEAVKAIYDHFAKQKIYYDYKKNPNTSAIIEYALRRVKEELEEEQGGHTPPAAEPPR